MMADAIRSHHDVAIVGARAAGAATALLLARMGYDVVVLERATFPSDTRSTHSIARSGVVQLARWGLLDRVVASGAPPIRQVTFHTDKESISRRVKDRAGVDHLLAPRRYVLDTILAEAAQATGADVRFGVSVTGVSHDGHRRAVGLAGHNRAGDPVEVAARFVIGADGLWSRVARAVEAPIVDARPSHTATAYAYYSGIAWPGNEYFLTEQALAGVFPTHGGEACVWVCTPADTAVAARRPLDAPTAAFDELLGRAAPSLAARLRRARRTSPVRGIMRPPNHVRQAVGRGWALVGDAGYHRDPITGHGISDAFRDAELLAVALDRALGGEVDSVAALAAYQRQRDEALRELFDVTCALAAFPPVAEFVGLQRRLSVAIEAESTWLAALPLPGESRLAVA